ncbi:anaerobic ribonucleoside-triphosphate reductase activating protein [Candidatus Woesearchaeota archaeon]|nr:anaerobic ribonucleoside-triphosphate reductase activating protein [Candidatus Woesearchaeota archaeon]
MNIRGLQKTSLIDYSPNSVSVVFTGGCNFRCPFCHNPDLVLRHEEIPRIEKQEIFRFVSEKKQWIDGVCITGGEPCMQKELPEFCSALKELGLLVKVDTNGTFPEVLKYLIENKLVDYIAMDIKSPLEDYDKAAGVKADKEKIKKSIELIRNSGLDYEFRTTIVPGLIGKKEIFRIAKMLNSSKRFCIQQFQGNVKLISEEFEKLEPCKESELNEMADIAKPYFDEVLVK